MMWNYGPWGMFPWMWIFPLAFLVIMLVFLFRGGGWPMSGGRNDRDTGPSARDILDRRYVQGEISREEYLQMKKDLE